MRRWRGRIPWLSGLSLAAALLAVAVLVSATRAPSPEDPPAASEASPSMLAGSVVVLPSVLDDGSSYTVRYVIDGDRTMGVAAAPDASSFDVVVVEREQILARVRSLPSSRAPSFDGFISYEGSIHWTETTRVEGTDATALWAAAVSGTRVGAPRIVVPDMGFAQLSGSTHDVIVADGRVSWAAPSATDQSATVVRSAPVAGPLSTRSERTWPGGWRQIDRPWLASTDPGPLVLLNQDTGERVTVPGSDVTATGCGPDRCRVRVTSGGDSVRLDLMAPDGSDRTAIAGPDTFFATVDPLVLGRYELLSQTGADLAPGQMRLLLYDASTGTTREVETGPRAQVSVRDGWAWWLTGESNAAVWHALHLAAL